MFNDELAALNEELKANAGQLRAMEVARLDRIIKSVWEYVTSEDSTIDERTKAAKTIIMAIKTKGEIQGFNAPKELVVEAKTATKKWVLGVTEDGIIETAEITQPADGSDSSSEIGQV